MARKHYHVLQGMEGGYLPDDNEVYTSRRDAESAAAWAARSARDDGYTVIGSAREGLYIIDMGCTLNNYIEITECFEPDCLIE
jgi:hypothetical protein